ncbi:DNA polymerase [Leptospira wolffii]|uniref:DNA polymerase domain-containing protein n=1 Tax=Leptospira wolffii TaxID=409998 RepID=UPI001083AF69|nr:DNA polymerase domain-containing protein [Leptospira wolffii]TGK62763.1 DNA polymerase [Leptospira wolffii]TGK73850.1 DNA polymerase [Leptospira wolffii]TGK75005.1 DNA polymerase [Leptospira wolffii]TGL28712.1 DNA polymerase [Leptospira wolffii]
MNLKTISGHLFDVYHAEDLVYIWIKDEEGKPSLFFDRFQPVIYARGEESILKKMILRLLELDAIEGIPVYEYRKLFYENIDVPVMKFIISRPSILPKISKKLYALYGKFDIYHSDLDLPTSYMFQKRVFPLCKLELEYIEDPGGKRIQNIRAVDSPSDMDYEVPNFEIMRLGLKKSHRIPMESNHLIVRTKSDYFEISGKEPKKLLEKLDMLLKAEDPDILLTMHGDQVILPYILSQAQKTGILPALDRDRFAPVRRNITSKGTSYFTYGNIVFRAPSYPLFGRWHIDSKNSFVYKEADLMGVIELARLSRLPMQKMARASTGKALTYIETDVALRNGYLVPWQKSAVEAPKTVLQLLEADKGGLVFQPDISEGKIAENVAQLDFAQMYPSIMAQHNISPECVNCLCCESDPNTPKAPDIGYRICNKRKGVVSEALEHVLKRRTYYKKQTKTATGQKLEDYQAKQASLKWMLVTSFGYLGYRNAKFGRLESHESVNAFGREKLLIAKETAEEFGYDFVHAITDSIFIKKSDSSPLLETELEPLCREIFNRTKIVMEVDGIYTWLLFPPSSQDKEMPVANRYMGRFQNGKLKCRGINARRKDLPRFIKEAQDEMLEWMRGKVTIKDLKEGEAEILNIYGKYDSLVSQKKIPWEDLLLFKSSSKELEEYEVMGATALSMLKLQDMGMEVQAGEKLRYIVVNRKAKTKDRRYMPEEELQLHPEREQIDIEYYRKLLLSAFREVWAEFASFRDFDALIDPQGRFDF